MVFRRKYIRCKSALDICSSGMDCSPSRNLSYYIRQSRRAAHMTGKEGDHVLPFFINDQDCRIRELVLHPGCDIADSNACCSDEEKGAVSPVSSDKHLYILRKRIHSASGVLLRRITEA